MVEKKKKRKSDMGDEGTPMLAESALAESLAMRGTMDSGVQTDEIDERVSELEKKLTPEEWTAEEQEILKRKKKLAKR